MIAATRSALKVFAAADGEAAGTVIVLAQPLKFSTHAAVATVNRALNALWLVVKILPRGLVVMRVSLLGCDGQSGARRKRWP